MRLIGLTRVVPLYNFKHTLLTKAAYIFICIWISKSRNNFSLSYKSRATRGPDRQSSESAGCPVTKDEPSTNKATSCSDTWWDGSIGDFCRIFKDFGRLYRCFRDFPIWPLVVSVDVASRGPCQQRPPFSVNSASNPTIGWSLWQTVRFGWSRRTRWPFFVWK